MLIKFIHFLLGLLFVTVLLTGLAFFAISEGWIGYVPELKQLDRPIDKFASQVLTSDGQSLGTYARSENRVFVSYDKNKQNVLNFKQIVLILQKIKQNNRISRSSRS